MQAVVGVQSHGMRPRLKTLGNCHGSVADVLPLFGQLCDTAQR